MLTKIKETTSTTTAATIIVIQICFESMLLFFMLTKFTRDLGICIYLENYKPTNSTLAPLTEAKLVAAK